jgi:hypothetical protein
MANGNGETKIDVKVAKGALAGAAAGITGGDRNYRSEEAFRDALRAAKKAGATDAECEKIVGAAVVNSIDRYGGPIAVGESVEQPRGLALTLSKIGSDQSRHFLAGFAKGLADELKKEARG